MISVARPSCFSDLCASRLFVVLWFRRQVGQNAPEELQVRDLKQELEEKERVHFDKVHTENRRKGLVASPAIEGEL